MEMLSPGEEWREEIRGGISEGMQAAERLIRTATSWSFLEDIKIILYNFTSQNNFNSNTMNRLIIFKPQCGQTQQKQSSGNYKEY